MAKKKTQIPPPSSSTTSRDRVNQLAASYQATKKGQTPVPTTSKSTPRYDDYPMPKGMSSVDRVNQLTAQIGKLKMAPNMPPPPPPQNYNQKSFNIPSNSYPTHNSHGKVPSSQERVNKLAQERAAAAAANANVTKKTSAPPTSSHKSKDAKKLMDLGFDLSLLPSSTSKVDAVRKEDFIPKHSLPPPPPPQQPSVISPHNPPFEFNFGTPSSNSNVKNWNSFTAAVAASQPLPPSVSPTLTSSSIATASTTTSQRTPIIKELMPEGTAGYVKTGERLPFTKAPPREDPRLREYSRNYADSEMLRPDLDWDTGVHSDFGDVHDGDLPSIAAVEQYEWKEWKQSKNPNSNNNSNVNSSLDAPPPISSFKPVPVVEEELVAVDVSGNVRCPHCRECFKVKNESAIIRY